MHSHRACKLLVCLLPFTARPPANPFIKILLLPIQTLLHQYLLMFHMIFEVLDQRSCLLGRILLHLADLLLQVQSARTILLTEKALLHVVSHQQTLDLVLIELAPTRYSVLIEIFTICLLNDLGSVYGDGFLSRWRVTTYSSIVLVMSSSETLPISI